MTSDAEDPSVELEGDDLANRPDPAPAPAPTGWRMPAAGAVMAGIALGLRDVFEPKKETRAAIEQPAPGQPLEPQRYEVHLNPQDPAASYAIVRPWVEESGAEEPPASG